ncbi:hypothetical protein D3C73_1234980 [compost metagenome]
MYVRLRGEKTSSRKPGLIRNHRRRRWMNCSITPINSRRQRTDRRSVQGLIFKPATASNPISRCCSCWDRTFTMTKATRSLIPMYRSNSSSVWSICISPAGLWRAISSRPMEPPSRIARQRWRSSRPHRRRRLQLRSAVTRSAGLSRPKARMEARHR